MDLVVRSAPAVHEVMLVVSRRYGGVTAAARRKWIFVPLVHSQSVALRPRAAAASWQTLRHARLAAATDITLGWPASSAHAT